MAPRTGSAREQARKLQQEEERKQKTQSLLLRVGVVVLALIVVGGLTFFVLNRDGNGSYTEGQAPAAANEQGGFVLTGGGEIAEGDSLGQIDSENLEGVETSEAGDLPPGVESREEGEPPHVVIYTDAGCPACGTFESSHHQLLSEWVDTGAITLEYRSVTWVSPPYSSQTANAFACMAEESPESYQSYVGEVTAVRADGTSEFSNEELAEFAEQNYGADISECVENGDYRAFAQYTSELASENGVSATPTIYVDDQEIPEFMNTGEVILEAVEAYQEETGEELAEDVEGDLEDADVDTGEEQTEGEGDDDES